ncbi:MAG: hypothetical protein ACPGIJ_11930 [Mycobacterium sp.]
MERKVAVENTLGIHKGVVIRRPLSEAQYLVATGQGRIVEQAVARKAETPEAPKGLDGMTKAELVELAIARGVEVRRAGGGHPRKSDYIQALGG